MDEGILRIFGRKSKHLSTKIIGRKVRYFRTVGSTNDLAYWSGLKGEKEGLVILAKHQTKGRGRQGRTWISPKGEGIYLSVLLRPKIVPAEASKITLLCVLSIVKAIQQLTKLAVLIKWPNDVVLNDRKICGILTEMSAEQDLVKFLVVGVGVNVNIKEENLPSGATSIMRELGKTVSVGELIDAILEWMDDYYLSLKEKGFKEILEESKSLSSILGSWVKVSCLDREREGQAVDIDQMGALILRTEEGFLERVFAGDLTKLT